MFKDAVADAVIAELEPIQQRYQKILGDKAYLEGLYRAGAEKAASVAQRTLRKVHKKVGFLPR